MKLIIDIDEDYVKIINKNGASNYPEEVIKNGKSYDKVIDELTELLEVNKAISNAVKALPKEEQPTGKWNVISILDDYVYLLCSECGKSTRLVRDDKNEFCCIKDVRDKIIACPYCGARCEEGGKEWIIKNRL